MSHRIQGYIISLALALSATAIEVQAEESVTLVTDIGVYNQYVWRGKPQGHGDNTAQLTLGAEAASGFSTDLWFGNGVDTTNADQTLESDVEYDIAVSYADSLMGLAYTVGYLRYDYVTNSAVTHELYMGLSVEVLSITATAMGYVDAETKDKFLELRLGYVADVFDVSSTLAMASRNDVAYVSVDLGAMVMPNVVAELSYVMPQGLQKEGGAADQLVVGIRASFE